MTGFFALLLFIALFYFTKPLAIIGLVLGFMALPFVLLAYALYKLIWPMLKKRLLLWQERRFMRKRVRAMLKKNLRYLP